MIRGPVAELAAVVGAMAVGLWAFTITENDAALLVVAAVVAAVMVASARRRRRAGVAQPPARVGAARAWVEAIGSAAVLTAAVAALMWLVREPYDTPRLWLLSRPGIDPAVFVARRLALAAAQQAVLQLFVWPVCREILRRDGPALVMAAAVFGLLHLPSPTLVAVTFVAAAVWIALYRRSRRLLPLVVSHALLWVAGYVLIPPRLSWDLKVGHEAWADRARYETLADATSRRILRQVTSPSYLDRIGGTDRAWVIALYRDILGRVPAESEVEFWLDRMRWEPRVEVARKFVVSEELADIRHRVGAAYDVPWSPTPTP